MALYVLLAAMVFGIAVDVDLFGRAFAVSWVDLAAVGVAVAGASAAWRRRRLRLDGALAAYLALGLVFVVQALVRPEPMDILGGASRFVTAGLALFGLLQLVPDRVWGTGEWERLWRWPSAFAVLAGAVGVWIGIDLAHALLDPDLVTFYDVKENIALPMGASNYLAGLLLPPVAVTVVWAARHPHRVPVAVLAAGGLAMTLSRGALLAAGAALLVGVVAGLSRAAAWRGAAAAGAVAVAAVALVGGLTAVTAAPEFDVQAASADPVGRRPEPPEDAAGLERILESSANAGRRILYRTAWETFVDEPVLGVGLNRLATVSSQTGLAHDNAHNLGLHALATTGLLGTLAYLGVWVLLVWRVWSLPSGAARTGLALGALALFLHAQVEALAFTRAVEVLLAIVLALTAAAPGARAVREVTIGRRGSGPR